MTQISRLLLAAALMTSPAALAADYDPPIVVDEAPEYQPVEIGSSWYLRGDVGYTLNHLPTMDIISGTQSQTSAVLSGGLGVGYYVTNWLRLDADLSFLNSDRWADTYASSCAGTQYTVVTDNGTGSIVSSTSAAAARPCDGENVISNMQSAGMVNAYADLGTYAGFTPYVGAGAGLSVSNYRIAVGDRLCSAEQGTTVAGGFTTTQTFLCNGQVAATDADVWYPGTEISKTQLGLAYSLSAGVAYQVAKNTQLDLGYRFTSLPSATYAYYDGVGPALGTGLNFHQVRVGLRYQIW